MANYESISEIVTKNLTAYSKIKTHYYNLKNQQGFKEKQKLLQMQSDLNEFPNRDYPYIHINCLYFEADDKKDISDICKGIFYTNRLVVDIKEYNLLKDTFFSFLPFNASTLKDSHLPTYSFYLQFPFRLAKPYISRDDEVFYLHENPVKKDKVFKVPLVSGSTWKGNLHWMAVHQMVEKWDGKSVENIACDRLRLSLLFGDEKGEEPGRMINLAGYLDNISPEAGLEYRKKLKAEFGRNADQSLPHHAGSLRFYPTFFNKIGLEVINPHNRQTRAGTNPIHIECAPIGSIGVFALLYVPLAHLAKEEKERKKRVADDLKVVYDSLQAMMLTYGFGAKKKAGFGEIEDKFIFTDYEYPKAIIDMKGLNYGKKDFVNFSDLESRVKTIKECLTKEPSHD
jgi:CRISPR/Cas system CMR subunit Cmr6 (Cas7 group RAMP superfamily)